MRKKIIKKEKEMVTQKIGFGQKSYTAYKLGCVFGSFQFKKHSVPDNFVIIGRNLQTLHITSLQLCKIRFQTETFL